MHKILDIDLDRLRAWITDKRTDDEVRETFHEKNRRYFSETCLCVASGWRMSIWMHFFFSFASRLRQPGYLLLKTSQLQTQSLWFGIVTLLYHILVAKWPLYNVHANHWVILCLDLVSCQVKVWDSLLSLTTAEEMRNILLPIRESVPNLLDSTGFFARRGRSSTYKEP
ncbi:hypothetical protein IC575_011716 [Cucumis melo]